MRAIAATLAMLLLPACNMVISDKPWFTAAGPVQQKEGLWVTVDNPDCKFEPAARLIDLPDCASPMLISGDAYSGPRSDKSIPVEQRLDPATWQKLPHLLADGTPLIDQMRYDPPKRDEPGSVAPPRALGGKLTFLYIAVRPTAFDEQGRIIATERWPVLCGPLRDGEKTNKGAPRFVTAKPFPGLKVVEDMACTARNLDSLRGAAAASEALAAASGYPIARSRWVRDKP